MVPFFVICFQQIFNILQLHDTEDQHGELVSLNGKGLGGLWFAIPIQEDLRSSGEASVPILLRDCFSLFFESKFL